MMEGGSWEEERENIPLVEFFSHTQVRPLDK